LEETNNKLVMFVSIPPNRYNTYPYAHLADSLSHIKGFADSNLAACLCFTRISTVFDIIHQNHWWFFTLFVAKLQKVCILGWGVVREWKYEVGEATV